MASPSCAWLRQNVKTTKRRLGYQWITRQPGGWGTNGSLANLEVGVPIANLEVGVPIANLEDERTNHCYRCIDCCIFCSDSIRRAARAWSMGQVRASGIFLAMISMVFSQGFRRQPEGLIRGSSQLPAKSLLSFRKPSAL